MKFDLKKPCRDCPFRSDIAGYLTKARVHEIIESISRGQKTFSCHKTNDTSGSETVETRNSQHCAGAMIFLEKNGAPNQMMRIAERLGMYDHTKLHMDAPVFDNASDMIAAQPR